MTAEVAFYVSVDLHDFYVVGNSEHKKETLRLSILIILQGKKLK